MNDHGDEQDVDLDLAQTPVCTVNDQPEALHGVGEAQDEPRQHVLWEPDVLEEAMQLLHLAAVEGLPRQVGSQLGESDVLALHQREDQGCQERQTRGT